jgi:GAF domain-containing protein
VAGGAKELAYKRIRARLEGQLGECPDLVAAMATAAALLKEGLDHLFWVGFYLPEADGSLRVGPYQGPPAGVRLPAGEGVCGAAVREGRSVVVPDVHAFEGHIACDLRSKSEIVVPLLAGDRLLAVLDADSDRADAFDEVDRVQLEALAATLSGVSSREDAR